MNKIYKVSQIPKDLPKPVIDRFKEDINDMDCWYGSDRNIDSEGGFFYVIQNEKDYESIPSVYCLGNKSIIPEIVEVIDNSKYMRILVIISLDYHIIYYVREDLVPERVLEYMD
ncbi:MAG: hypothetical protein ACLFPS_09180 [Clostridia bacterium]